MLSTSDLVVVDLYVVDFVELFWMCNLALQTMGFVQLCFQLHLLVGIATIMVFYMLTGVAHIRIKLFLRTIACNIS